MRKPSASGDVPGRAASTGRNTAAEPQANTTLAKDAESFICYPELGGRLDSLRLPLQSAGTGEALSVVEILRQLEDVALIREDYTYNNTLLFPFPNRLYQGRYRFNGQPLVFPVNDDETGNALHGFLFDEALELHTATCCEAEPQRFKALRLGLEYAGKKEYYPFQMSLEVRYFFNNERKFCVDIIVENTGEEPAPVAAGWHPYFTFGHPVDTLELDLPSMQRILIDDKMIPTGHKQPFQRFASATNQDLRLKSDRYDTCFRLDKPASPQAGFQSYIYSPVLDMTLLLEQSQNLPYLQLFTPENRQSLALEPVSANINAFQNGEGLRILEPGRKEVYRVRLGLYEGRTARKT